MSVAQKSGKTLHLGMAAVAILAAVQVQAAEPRPLAVKPTVSDIVKASRPGDWRPLDPANTLYMQLAGGRVVIELAPAFAPRHVANIKALVKEQYFDGLAVVRSQDNYVVQWGDPDEAKPRAFKSARAKVEAEFSVPMNSTGLFTRLASPDVYAAQVGHSNGFPSARDPKSKQAWLAHCYGMVGVGRDNDSDSGNGSSLYAVNGHAPRHLDRNITVVGRVVAGMPLLSTLPRGTAALGFYDKPELNVPILSVKLAADVPEAERSKLEVMRTDSATYQLAVEAQRHRGGPWNKFDAGQVELCNVPIPVREQK
jgi:peptidylprolyl isomerase